MCMGEPAAANAAGRKDARQARVCMGEHLDVGFAAFALCTVHYCTA